MKPCNAAILPFDFMKVNSKNDGHRWRESEGGELSSCLSPRYVLDCPTGGVVRALTGEAYIQPLICMSQVQILLSAPVDIAQPGRATEEYRFANLRGRLTSPAIIS